jgi:hypothetical protein
MYRLVTKFSVNSSVVQGITAPGDLWCVRLCGQLQGTIAFDSGGLRNFKATDACYGPSIRDIGIS